MENVWDSEKRWYRDPGLSQNMKYACAGILTYFDCDRSLSSIIEQGKPRHCHIFFPQGARWLLCRVINLRTLNFPLCLNLFWDLHDSKVIRRIYGTFCSFGVHKILVAVVNCHSCYPQCWLHSNVSLTEAAVEGGDGEAFAADVNSVRKHPVQWCFSLSALSGFQLVLTDCRKKNKDGVKIQASV